MCSRERSGSCRPSSLTNRDLCRNDGRTPNRSVSSATVNLFRVKATLESVGVTGLSELDPEVWDKSVASTTNVASASAVAGAYGDVPVRFLGRTALIDNKKASGRPKDLADVDLLTSDDPDYTG